MAASSIKESLMAIIPISGRRYQQGWERRVMEESMMSSETRKKACSFNKGEVALNTSGKLTYEFNAPAKHSRLEVLILSQRASLENLDGVNDRYSTVELPAWDVVVQILMRYSSKKFSNKKSANGPCDTTPLLLLASPPLRNAAIAPHEWRQRHLRTLPC